MERIEVTDKDENPTIYGYNKIIDKNLRSKSPWVVIATCTIGTPLLVCVLASRGMRRQGDKLDLSLLPIIAGVSTVAGLLIGLTVVAYYKYKELRATEASVPFWLRLLFDGQPMKLIFIGVPLLFVIAIAIGVIWA